MFRNLTYTFRASAYPRQPITLQDGRYVERSELGPEWTVELERTDRIKLGGTTGSMLRFFANHVGGSGSAGHVLVVRCNGKVIEVVFEAGGAGVNSKYSGGTLTITYPVWIVADAHAFPSRSIARTINGTQFGVSSS